MSEYRPELANDGELREAVRHMLTREGYEFNEHVSVRDYSIDFVAWKPASPDHVIITLTAGSADLTMVGKILALLGRYREEQNPSACAWVIAKDFTSGAGDAAKACPDQTLKWSQVHVSIVDAQRCTVQA
jgi:hypothetical protein